MLHACALTGKMKASSPLAEESRSSFVLPHLGTFLAPGSGRDRTNLTLIRTKKHYVIQIISVLDPHWFQRVSNPTFLANADPDPGPGLDDKKPLKKFHCRNFFI